MGRHKKGYMPSTGGTNIVGTRPDRPTPTTNRHRRSTTSVENPISTTTSTGGARAHHREPSVQDYRNKMKPKNGGK